MEFIFRVVGASVAIFSLAVVCSMLFGGCTYVKVKCDGKGAIRSMPFGADCDSGFEYEEHGKDYTP